jgi:BirA family biotin operon repressor/biotin-[acetyl-CoA-carboxylase] ligase
MDERTLRKTLSGIPLGGLRYFEQTGSTNDIALAWAAAGSPDLALVYAEEQTAGRGRGTRRWFTPAGAALAFSLVLRPLAGAEQPISLFSTLGALAVCEALEKHALQPQIKWPNDVLLNRRKVCGILAESVWLGEQVESVVLGVGLNIKPEAVPPPGQLNFPATCLEDELPSRNQIQAHERAELLAQILQSMLAWRTRVITADFLQALEGRLAFRGEMVEIWENTQVINLGKVKGLGQGGSLLLLSSQGQTIAVQFGEVHMSPVA